MKKLAMIAGGVGVVAMLGVAALPLATYGLSDDVSVTIGSTCGLTISSSKSEGTGAGAQPGYLGSDTKNSLLAATLTAGQAVNATTQTPTANTELFTHAQVICNDAAGYTLNVKATAADDVDMSGENVTTHTIAGAAGAPVAGTESYAWYVPAYTGGQASAAWLIPSVTGYNITVTAVPSANDGDNFYVNYGVGTSNSTEADTYSASVTYTLTPNTP